ncbi:MAG TPA: HPr family phosphocarrier protein [Halothiobacillus sp.]|nr:HPr family phosphocarrier protein [Halothiobacillus sp.]
MQHKSVQIINKRGLHARAAAKFATTASQFASSIQVQLGNFQVNGKSIMGLMMLAATQGTELHISATGDDAEAALDALEKLVLGGFGEDE